MLRIVTLTLRDLQSFTAQRNNPFPEIKITAVGKTAAVFAYNGRGEAVFDNKETAGQPVRTDRKKTQNTAIF